MRILDQSIDANEPVYRNVVVAVPDGGSPPIGTSVTIEGVRYFVEAAYRWHERFAFELDYREGAVELRIRLEDSGSVGSGERLRPRPPSLDRDAEAQTIEPDADAE